MHRKVTCQNCGVAKRSTLVDKVSKLCTVCGNKAKTQVNVKLAPLTSKALERFQQRPVNEVVQQNNQMEMIDTMSQAARGFGKLAE